MALIIDKEHPSGITLRYWNILSIDLSVEDMVNATNIKLRGYIDKPLRDNGYKHYHVETIHLNNIKERLLENSQESSNIYQMFYKIIKEHPDWINAIDDI